MAAPTAVETAALDDLDIIGPDRYRDHGYPHEEWKRLRRESPIHWYDVPRGVGPQKCQPVSREDQERVRDQRVADVDEIGGGRRMPRTSSR